jgi:hypothetical protein
MAEERVENTDGPARLRAIADVGIERVPSIAEILDRNRQAQREDGTEQRDP